MGPDSGVRQGGRGYGGQSRLPGLRERTLVQDDAYRAGKIMRRIAELIEQHAEHLGEVEVRDNGKLISEMVAQTKYMPQWFHYYGGLADKIQAQWFPSIARITSITSCESRWVSAPSSRPGTRR